MDSVEPSPADPLRGSSSPRASFWPEGWWRIMELRIGIIPVPIYLILLGVIVYFVAAGGRLPNDINLSIAVLAIGGFSCAELGKRLPLIRQVGGAAILATFIPSVLVYVHWLPASLVSSVTDFTVSSNFLYLFIAAIIVGSILGMDRHVLLRGFLKIFVPLAAGSAMAALVGTAVGTALGLGARQSLFFIVVPIMAGGVGEGALPLSAGYAAVLHAPQGELFAQVLPIVMLGSLTAILLAGGLDRLGRQFPHLTGTGRLQPQERQGMELATQAPESRNSQIDVARVAAAALVAISLYLLGLACQHRLGWPAPLVMLFLAVLVKLTRAASPHLQAGSLFVFRFFQVAVTYPLLFAIGVAMTPWETLVAAFALPKLVTIVATVATLIGTGFVVGRWVKLYPIEAAIVNACHSGQGGTGDVAILTAANRMQLMPFAQIATRIGGAITVTLALMLVRRGY
ncbi:MAG TPA: 2-hydroxycarboxylate transporter family protein [Steroidobacteraceae bacterium]|nr:2-hydroxycarboxylate transporter family protein [Steroidobacteraceae bacterium]